MADYVRRMPEAGAPFTRPGVARQWHIDPPLLTLLLLLSGYGLLVLYSASGQSVQAVLRQARYFALAYVGMFAVARCSVVRLARWSPRVYLLGVSMLLAVALFGVGAKGAQRWLDLGVLRFQPSEIMKLAVPMSVAWYLDKGLLPPSPKSVAACLLIIITPCALILGQPDLGTSLLIAASGLFGIFMAGIG